MKKKNTLEKVFGFLGFLVVLLPQIRVVSSVIRRQRKSGETSGNKKPEREGEGEREREADVQSNLGSSFRKRTISFASKDGFRRINRAHYKTTFKKTWEARAANKLKQEKHFCVIFDRFVT